MEQLPKIVRQRLQATAKAGVHPDPDLLTAFAEKSLKERERSLVLQHLAQCADCRSVISLAIPEVEAAPFHSGEIENSVAHLACTAVGCTGGVRCGGKRGGNSPLRATAKLGAHDCQDNSRVCAARERRRRKSDFQPGRGKTGGKNYASFVRG